MASRMCRSLRVGTCSLSCQTCICSLFELLVCVTPAQSWRCQIGNNHIWTSIPWTSKTSPQTRRRGYLTSTCKPSHFPWCIFRDGCRVGGNRLGLRDPWSAQDQCSPRSCPCPRSLSLVERPWLPLHFGYPYVPLKRCLDLVVLMKHQFEKEIRTASLNARANVTVVVIELPLRGPGTRAFPFRPDNDIMYLTVRFHTPCYIN